MESVYFEKLSFFSQIFTHQNKPKLLISHELKKCFTYYFINTKENGFCAFYRHSSKKINIIFHTSWLPLKIQHFLYSLNQFLQRYNFNLLYWFNLPLIIFNMLYAPLDQKQWVKMTIISQSDQFIPTHFVYILYQLLPIIENNMIFVILRLANFTKYNGFSCSHLVAKRQDLILFYD